MVNAPGNEHANVGAAPDGRLWLMWEQNGKVYATRTNKAGTRIGPPSVLKPPSGGSIYRLNGEGSAGPLDLIANIQAGRSQGLWHQQAWPRLQLAANAKATVSGRTITFRVLDAGDPVAGATVRAAGRRLTTAPNGTATLKQATPARVEATASKAGYVSVSTSVR